MNYLFKNCKKCAVRLPDKNGNLINFTSGQSRTLDEFFKKYVPKHLMIVKEIETIKNFKLYNDTTIKLPDTNKHRHKSNDRLKILTDRIRKNKIVSNRKVYKTNGKVVGKASINDYDRATEFSITALDDNNVSISNQIGIGILSYNRLESISNLLKSIRKYTDLKKTTVFVSDESTDIRVWEWLSKQNDIIAFHNQRKGIAVNSNRLLRCLERFKYKLILNDDVLVLKEGWDSFYFNIMNSTNLRHFCYYENNLYGAKRYCNKDGFVTVTDKPHGAVLAIHHDAFKKVGYFDENFGMYGMEHVDYSDRISKSCHGHDNIYYDIANSDKFFKITKEKSSDPNKYENFMKSKEYYNSVKNDNNRIYVPPTDKSILPSVSYVIPFRDSGRKNCLMTVVNNIRAQKFPIIQIIIVEQDQMNKLIYNEFPCDTYCFVKNWINNMHFCKSAAFNKGVSLSNNLKIILHDADMLINSDYTMKMSKLLDKYESVHIGETVCYLDKLSTDCVIKNSELNKNNIKSNRVVAYYEGGSLGIDKDVYIRIGGFNEQFIGYGVEDCEFYNRLIKLTNSFTERSIDLFHLWHDRTPGWEDCHNKNKLIYEEINKKSLEIYKNELNKCLVNKYFRGNDENINS